MSTSRKQDLVYGFGNTGLSIARYLSRQQSPAIYIDSRATPPGVAALKQIQPAAEILVGPPDPNVLTRVNRIIVSPGISDDDAFLVAARAAGIEIVSDIELFVEQATAPFVAITGSNGKSTVTTLLTKMCEAAGLTAHAGANLGTPALDLLAAETPDLFVLELSSFQLQRTRHLPARIAVLLNISADHLDWHRDEAEYREAKYRILNEASAVVINRTDAESRNRVTAEQTCRSFALNEPRRQNYGLTEHDGETFLSRGDERLLPTSKIALVGVHNQENALAALATGDVLGLPMPAMLSVLESFAGLPHRMQRVRRWHDVDFINDSKATNVAAAIAAVSSVGGPVVLIAGGQGKGGDFSAFAAAVHDKLRAAVLIGEDADVIAGAFANKTNILHADSLGAAVSLAAREAQSGDTVLLAPACASFDQFANYMQRGIAFCDAVEALR
ncbi:MAG: UDP-N-acetylmuramoyl-L-alanine--D-glutamate ligase [Woeseia sp.]|nr:UDP-N-acetylmuramoyl-L-alanine--D-glutamate ligase [Woeseia sp.]